MDSATIEDRFRTDGVELFCRSWRPEGESRALILIVHGIGEHSGRYERYVDAFLARELAVYAYDQRGHGRSPGQRGHVDAWEEYRDDLGAFLSRARDSEAGLPVFLLGHSMGALVALDFVLAAGAGPEGNLRGLILSGIPLDPVGVAKPWLVLTAKVLSRLRPRTSLRSRIDPNALSRDPEVACEYAEDPLVHHQATARWGTEALDAIARVKRRLADVRVPLLVLHGGADEINSPAGSRLLADGAQSADKTVRIYNGARHEPHNDLGWQQVVADVAGWIEARIQPGYTAAGRAES